VQVEARIKAQLSDDERRKHAAIVISNDGTIDDLRAKLAEAWRAALERNRNEEAKQ
jgi:dephospho-CoA kinase